MGERAIKILGYSTKKITKVDPDHRRPIRTDPYQLPTGDDRDLPRGRGRAVVGPSMGG
jgi:hypothetical protein